MSPVLHIALTDSRRLLRSPLVWWMLASLQGLIGAVFWLLLNDYAVSGSPDGRSGITAQVAAQLCGFAAWLLLLSVPLLAMRSLAEERARNSLPLLLSAPVSEGGIVLGKFLGLLLPLALQLGLLTLTCLSLRLTGPLDWGLLAGSLLGLSLMVAAFAALSLMISSLCSQPTSAALLGIALLLALWLLDSANESLLFGPWLLRDFSLLGHFAALRQGLFDTADIGFFLALILLGLVWARLLLQAGRRWRPALGLGLLLSALVFTLAVPVLARYRLQFDWTANARNSIPVAAQELLRQMPGPIQARALVPTDKDLRRAIRARLAPFQRAKPDFSLRFIDPATAPDLAQALEIARGGELVLDYQGRQEKLSVIDRRTLAQALLRLSRSHHAQVYWLSGHGEGDPDDSGGRGFDQVAGLLKERGASVEQLRLALSSQVPDDADLLIVAAPEQALLPAELERIDHYLADGGNLLWLRDPDSAPAWPAQLPVRPLPGTVFYRDYQRLGLPHPGVVVIAEFPDHPATARLDGMVVLTLAGGLQASRTSAWTTRPLLTSTPAAWLEQDGLAPAMQQDAPREPGGPLHLALSLARASPTGSQRVILIADSDALRNGSMDQLSNRSLAAGLLDWLLQADTVPGWQEPRAPDLRMSLSPALARGLLLGWVIGLPLALLAAGFWQQRRARRPTR